MNGEVVSKTKAIRNAFFRLGLHATPKAVALALSRQGFQVTEELVCQVRFEILKERTSDRPNRVSRSVLLTGVRRCPQGFPRR
jgi:hypothetical protein